MPDLFIDCLDEIVLICGDVYPVLGLAAPTHGSLNNVVEWNTVNGSNFLFDWIFFKILLLHGQNAADEQAQR